MELAAPLLNASLHHVQTLIVIVGVDRVAHFNFARWYGLFDHMAHIIG
jgi:hypothetical protein